MQTQPQDVPASIRQTHRTFVLIALAAALSACGSDSQTTSQPPQASQPGRLLVLNADQSIISCSVDNAGEVDSCQELAIQASIGPGSIETSGDAVFIGSLSGNTITECRLDTMGQITQCAVSRRQLSAAPMGKTTIGKYLLAANADDTIAICDTTMATTEACTTSSAEGLLSQPFSVAASAHHLYITNVGSASIVSCRLDTTDNPQAVDCRQFNEDNLFANPTGIVFDSNRIYVTDASTHAVITCNATDGSIANCSLHADALNLQAPLDIVVNGNKAYVANLYGHSVSICELSVDGRISRCEAAAAADLFSFPGGLAFTPASNL